MLKIAKSTFIHSPRNHSPNSTLKSQLKATYWKYLCQFNREYSNSIHPYKYWHLAQAMNFSGLNHRSPPAKKLGFSPCLTQVLFSLEALIWPVLSVFFLGLIICHPLTSLLVITALTVAHILLVSISNHSKQRGITKSILADKELFLCLCCYISDLLAKDWQYLSTQLPAQASADNNISQVEELLQISSGVGFDAHKLADCLDKARDNLARLKACEEYEHRIKNEILDFWLLVKTYATNNVDFLLDPSQELLLCQMSSTVSEIDQQLDKVSAKRLTGITTLSSRLEVAKFEFNRCNALDRQIKILDFVNSADSKNCPYSLEASGDIQFKDKE